MGNSLAVEWLRLSTFTVKGPGSSPGQETKIPQSVQHSQKKKKKKERDTIRKIKRQLTEWEKIFGNHISVKSLLSRIYKQFLQLLR